MGRLTTTLDALWRFDPPDAGAVVQRLLDHGDTCTWWWTVPARPVEEHGPVAVTEFLPALLREQCAARGLVVYLLTKVAEGRVYVLDVERGRSYCPGVDK